MLRAVRMRGGRRAGDVAGSATIDLVYWGFRSSNISRNSRHATTLQLQAFAATAGTYL